MLPVCVNVNLTSSCMQSISIIRYFDQTKPMYETSYLLYIEGQRWMRKSSSGNKKIICFKNYYCSFSV